MNKQVELPLEVPPFSTYHYQAINGAVIGKNPSIKNWFYNQMINLRCDRAFLGGYTTPVFSVVWSDFTDNPHLEIITIPLKYLKGHAHFVIRNLLDDGYYVAYGGIDDYFVEGKSWYGERHFAHDGLICGYDQGDKTYTIYAYDKNWVCRTFKTPQEGLEKGWRYMFKEGVFGLLRAVKPKEAYVELNLKTMCGKLREYLDSSLEKYPPDLERNPVEKQKRTYGIAVQDYLCLYLDKLLDGTIPHERLDRRVFRLVWEHKAVMLDRIRTVEKHLILSSEIGDAYAPLVKQADGIRMMYALYHAQRRDSLPKTMKKSLQELRAAEEPILRAFVRSIEEAMKK